MTSSWTGNRPLEPINSSEASEAYMQHRLLLDQITDCRLFGTKPLSDPMWTHRCELHVHSRKCIKKCRMPMVTILARAQCVNTTFSGVYMCNAAFEAWYYMNCYVFIIMRSFQAHAQWNSAITICIPRSTTSGMSRLWTTMFCCFVLIEVTDLANP